MSGSIFPDGVFGKPHELCDQRVRENVKTIHRLRDCLRDCQRRMKAARGVLKEAPTSSDVQHARRLLDRRNRLR